MIWKEFTIGELCIKVTDGSHYSPKELSEGYPMFSVKDMVENGFDYSAVKRISEKDFIKPHHPQHHRGDLDGVWRALRRRAAGRAELPPDLDREL